MDASNISKLLLSFLTISLTFVSTIPQIANAKNLNPHARLDTSDNHTSPLLAEVNCVAKNNFSETANAFISRCRKAGIRSEFPSELINKTLGEINKGSAANYNKAWKLLNDSRWLK